MARITPIQSENNYSEQSALAVTENLSMTTSEDCTFLTFNNEMIFWYGESICPKPKIDALSPGYDKNSLTHTFSVRFQFIQ